MTKAFTYVAAAEVHLSSGNANDILYANGQNQIAVTISFIVYDALYNRVLLTKEQIKECVFLGDYHLGTVLIPGSIDNGWSVSTTSGDFVTAGTSNSNLSATEDYQSITYYVSCPQYTTFSRTLCAFLTPDNFETYVTSGLGSELDSGVTLTPLPPISYDYLDLSIARSDASNGEYNGHTVDQDNYYVSNPSGTIKKSALEEGSSYNYYIMEKSSTEDYYQMGFEVGPQSTYNLVLDDRTSIPVVYNQRAGQLCLVRLIVSGSNSYNLHNNTCDMNIYDAYGNHGYLSFYAADYGNRIDMTNA